MNPETEIRNDESEIGDGGPAFPSCDYEFQPCSGVQVIARQFYGLSRLDWFAGQALAGMLANPTRSGNYQSFASDAVSFAKLIISEIKERSK